ncbi:MAG: hypothetical protein JNK05_00140 [Myxococcales bacterium]|nr:hypothetical protein [Myxococcales bacterium]
MLVAAALTGCGANAEWINSDGGARDAGVSVRDASTGATDSSTSDARPQVFDCATEGGRGELIVRLQLAPSVDTSDLWIVALCGRTHNAGPSDELPMRLVRVPRGETTITLSGLGEGYYRVVASATGIPAAASTVGVLRSGTSAGTFVSVGASMTPLLSVESPMTAMDAGVAPMRDASLPSGDASRDAIADGAADVPTDVPQAAAPVAEFDVNSIAGAALGRIGVRLERRDDQWFDASFKLENLCATMVCPTLVVSGVELRVEQSGTPRALVLVNLSAMSRGTSLSGRETFQTPTRLVPASAIGPGARLRLTVFGSIDL